MIIEKSWETITIGELDNENEIELTIETDTAYAVIFLNIQEIIAVKKHLEGVIKKFESNE